MWKYLPAVLLIGLSLLSVFRAPTNFLWKVSIIITEFSWVPILLTLIVACISYYYHPKSFVLQGMYLIALLLFVLPVVRAYTESNALQQELSQEFGSKTPENAQKSPYSFWGSFGFGGEEHAFEELTYQTVDGKDYTCRFYHANTTKPAPLVIVIHGGSWAAGDAGQIPELNSYLANRGVHVISLNYRLAPKYKYPSQIDDVEAVIQMAKCNPPKTYPGIQFSKIILLGRSAGGQIALQSAYGKLRDQVDGVISFYAPADMLWGAKQITNNWVLDVDKVLLDYIGCSVKDNEAPYIAASAPPLVNGKTPPTLIIHGKIDAMVSHEHSVRLMKALRKHHIKSHLIELSSATHGCDFNFNGPSGQISTYAIERFIENL